MFCRRFRRKACAVAADAAVGAPASCRLGRASRGTPIVTVIPSATAVPTPDAGVFFSMGSDWGSAFTNQEINYDILFQNTRESGVINNLSIISALPNNLLFVSASAGIWPGSEHAHQH